MFFFETQCRQQYESCTVGPGNPADQIITCSTDTQEPDLHM